MDYNTIQDIQDIQEQEPSALEIAMEKIYVQLLKNKAAIKSIQDNIFDTIIAVFVGTILVILCNRFVPVNFMGYDGVQPYLSIGIALSTAGYLAYKAFIKNSKLRK